MTRRDLAAVAAIAIGAALLFGGSWVAYLDGLGIDALFWLRHEFAAVHAPGDAPVAVIAIDEETYRRDPFKDTPQVMWTPQQAKLLDALLDAGATAVGYDVTYSTSVESLVPGYERGFLRSLHRGAGDGRVLLSKAQHQQQAIEPYVGFQRAAGGPDNVRSVNLDEDEDGVVRRVPLFIDTLDVDQKVVPEPAFALELAGRARRTKAERGSDGIARLGGMPIRAADADSLGVNFDTRPGAVPTYSFADMVACADAGKTEYFREHFAGRIVLVGTVLDVEDRRLTAERFATSPEGVNAPERCAVPVMPGLIRADFRRDTIPGVYIHAAAIANLLRGDAWIPIPWPERWALLLVLAALTSLAAMRFRLSIAAAATLGLLAGWTAGSIAAFSEAMQVLPLLNGCAAMLVSFGASLAYRFGVTDRERRFVAKAFALYLPPAEVARMVASGAMPRLGGEARTVSILFTDLASFARVSEYLDPAHLAAALNTYFAAVTEIVARHHGIVDKFIGDAVVAIFGAPLDDPDHALNAVRAAMAIRAASGDAARELARSGGRPPATRIGVNTGPVVVGNIGSPLRFNYTAMGDAVNLASRLEGVNKRYGTLVLVSDATAQACGEAIAFREIDTVAVKGRERPVALFEPLGLTGDVPADLLARRDAFARALRLWRLGSFAEASAAFEPLADGDPAAAHFATLARSYARNPPADWQGVSILTDK
ncbi:MAG TPA: adenylate/guanylate cyclase domain-containing protein [Stellaceae bacterium]|nr:adenylate/guanylate cyclase domain-containing protein [Stellaceae bacterium]